MRFDGEHTKRIFQALSLSKLSNVGRPAQAPAKSKIIKSEDGMELKTDEIAKSLQEGLGDMIKEGSEEAVATALESELTKKLGPVTETVAALEKSIEEMKTQKSEAPEQADEIFKSEDGTVLRKSVLGGAYDAMVDLMKKKDEQAREIRLMKKADEVEKTHPNLPGDPVQKARVMEYIERLPEEDQKYMDSLLKSANEAIGNMVVEKGYNFVDTEKSAEEKLIEQKYGEKK